MRVADAQNKNILIFAQGINHEVGAYRMHPNRGIDFTAQMGCAGVFRKKDESRKKLSVIPPGLINAERFCAADKDLNQIFVRGTAEQVAH